LSVCFLAGRDFWRALAYIGFVLNLFNLLPVVPLDGGRAMAALSPAVWLAGLAGLVALTIFYPSPILFLIMIFGGMESWRRWKARATPEGRSYYALPTRTRRLLGAAAPDPAQGARRRRLPRPRRRPLGRGRGDVPLARRLSPCRPVAPSFGG